MATVSLTDEERARRIKLIIFDGDCGNSSFLHESDLLEYVYMEQSIKMQAVHEIMEIEERSPHRKNDG